MNESTFEDLVGMTAQQMIDDDNERWERMVKYGLEVGCGPFFALGINDNKKGEQNE